VDRAFLCERRKLTIERDRRLPCWQPKHHARVRRDQPGDLCGQRAGGRSSTGKNADVHLT
jgi:hypothetical protein